MPKFALEPIQLPTHWPAVTFSPIVKQPGREPESTSSNIEFNNYWRCTSLSPCALYLAFFQVVIMTFQLAVRWGQRTQKWSGRRHLVRTKYKWYV